MNNKQNIKVKSFFRGWQKVDIETAKDDLKDFCEEE